MSPVSSSTSALRGTKAGADRRHEATEAKRSQPSLTIETPSTVAPLLLLGGVGGRRAGALDVDVARALADGEALESEGVAGEVERVLHEHGDGHGPNAAGHGGDEGALGRHLLEGDVADEAVAALLEGKEGLFIGPEKTEIR